MKKVRLIFLFILTLSIFDCSTTGKGEITTVSTEEMKILLDLEDAQLIDVRTEDEHNLGHLANSQNIDFNSPTFDADITVLDKEKPVVLYCQKGGRSARCAKKMRAAGFKKVYDLKGGFSKWQFKKLDLKLKS